MFVLLSGQELAQHLGSITQLTSLLAEDVTVLINMHLGEVDAERTDLHFAKVVNGHKKQKPNYSPPAPRFQRDTSTYSACFFTLCLTDEVFLHGNMVRLQSDI